MMKLENGICFQFESLYVNALANSGVVGLMALLAYWYSLLKFSSHYLFTI